MMNRSFTATCVTAIALVLVSAPAAEAQLGGLARRATRAAEDGLAAEIDRLVREGVRCAFYDAACIQQAEANGQTPVMTDGSGNLITDEDGKPLTDPEEASKQAGEATRPGEGAWANYDFVPGDRVLFYDDYSDDRVGDFPRPFDLLEGNWEVVEWQGQRFIRGISGGTISVELPETLPERFTIEFPASVQHGNASLKISTAPIDHGNRDFAGSAIVLRTVEAGLIPVRNEGPRVTTPRREGASGEALVTVRVMADGGYMKVYLDDHRVANAPNAVFPRGKTLYFTIAYAYEEMPALIGPIRIAAGGLDLYDRLEAEGRVATQGIYFAVDSDVIQPESTGTLREIGDMLTSHSDLQLSIEGHTDSDGEDAYNLELSQRRAAAVKSYLVQAFDIDAVRLEAEGFGETVPAADNATPEGKQQNRRVELVKIGG